MRRRWTLSNRRCYDRVFPAIAAVMKSESLAFAIAGVCFGLIVGWIIGAEQQRSVPGRPPSAQAQAQQSAAANADASGSTRPGAALNEARARELQQAVDRNKKDADGRVALANLYFDAERYSDAAKWYEEALALRPRDVNVSTDLGVSYYYLNQPDRALKQFDYSLSVDPAHTKTILNLGIVRAFGKQDLQGAAQAWQRVIDLAPDSAEAQAARRALDSMKAAHPGLGGAGNQSGG